MPNTNCLAGVACPKCRQADSVLIEAVVVVRVTDNGIDEHCSHHSWDSDSYCVCPQCEHSGTVGEFGTEVGEGGAR